MKLKYTLLFTIISFFITAAGFSQQNSIQKIGAAEDCSTAPINTGKIVNLSTSGNFESPLILVNASNEFSFYSWGNDFSDKKFEWDLLNTNDERVAHGTTQNFTFTATTLGKYILKLKVKDDRAGCYRDISKPLNVVDACTYTDGERRGNINFENEFSTGALFMNVNETKNLSHSFMYNEQKPGYNYYWKLYSPDSTFIGEGRQKIFPITLTRGGYHRVTVDVIDPVTGCFTTTSKTINSIISNSCVNTNPKSRIIAGLYVNFIKSLIARSIMGESDADINSSTSSPEFMALKPYITNGPKDKIYHYKSIRIEEDEGAEDNSLRGIEFSFSPDRLADNRVHFDQGIYYDSQDDTYENLLSSINRVLYYDFEQYTSSDTPLISCQVNNYSRMKAEKSIKPQPGECDKETTIQYIDFCPAKECTPIVGTLKFVNTSPPAPAEKKTKKSASKI